MHEIKRSTIARLLATENITVVQDNVTTASFDVKNRVLRLPSWSDVESYTEDHLIGHEVGHALFTPFEGWHEAVCDMGAAYKSYLNVVEDARIEKLIQRKYPGLRTPFIKSYRKLLADGFFGGQLDDINKMSLIDRINVYFKCGLMSGVKFTNDEKQWLPRIESAETWEEVVAIVDGDALRDQLTLPMYAVLNQYGADGWRLVGQSVTPSQCEPHDPHLLYFHLTFIREVN